VLPRALMLCQYLPYIGPYLRGVSASQGSTLSPGGQKGPERAVTTQHRATPCPIWLCRCRVPGPLDPLGLRQLEVYRDPGPSGYSTEAVIAEEGLVALPIAGPPRSGGPLGMIAVVEVLPRAEGDAS